MICYTNIGSEPVGGVDPLDRTLWQLEQAILSVQVWLHRLPTRATFDRERDGDLCSCSRRPGVGACRDADAVIAAVDCCLARAARPRTKS
jgi:hypothetical protein